MRAHVTRTSIMHRPGSANPASGLSSHARSGLPAGGRTESASGTGPFGVRLLRGCGPGVVDLGLRDRRVGRPGRQGLLAEPAHALRVRPVQRQPGEELRRHAPALARVVERARRARAAGLRAAQVGEQLRVPPHALEPAGRAHVAGQEVLVDRERARVHVTHRVDQAHHPPRPAQVQPRQRLPVGRQVEERVAGQHPLTARDQPVVELLLLRRERVQLVPHVRAPPRRAAAG